MEGVSYGGRSFEVVLHSTVAKILRTSRNYSYSCHTKKAAKRLHPLYTSANFCVGTAGSPIRHWSHQVR